MRRYLLPIFISILVTIGAALVLATGYLAYKSISSIVASIHNEAKPDDKLLIIRDIATSLDQAENSVRIFAYTRNEDDLEPYKSLIQNINDQIVALEKAGTGNQRLVSNIDTISDLIEQKIIVWNEMLTLYNAKTATQYIDTISQKLESKIESDSLRKNRNIFKKIFKRQKKEELDEKQIIRNIEQFKEVDRQYEQQVKEKEIKLARTGKQLTTRLYNLIEKMKQDERADRAARLKEANILAEETYRWIGWFSIFGTVSGLLVIIVITVYIRKSRASQKALLASKQQVETLAKTKEQFMANVSHELRTPMNVISGFVDQLLKKPMEEGTRSTLKIIKSSSDHLVRIINDVLDFSKLQAGKMKLDKIHFNVDDLLEEIRLFFQKQATDKQLVFDVEKGDGFPTLLFGDPVRLKQILINLAGNSIKFTSQGFVKIAMDAENEKGRNFTLKILVEDTGIGIDKENLKKIFDDFTQADSATTRNYGGTGLGLSIVKKIVDLHKGTIEVESMKNKGSRFICKIPYEIGEKDEVLQFINKTSSIPEEVRQKKILVVDDEVYNRKLMGSILNKLSISFDEAGDGIQAMEILAKKQYDIILLDVQMPGADGFAVLEFVRKSLGISKNKTAIILTTARTVTKEDLEQFKKSGIDECLQKPFTEEQLVHTLGSLYSGMEKSSPQTGLQVEKTESLNSNPASLEELYKFAGKDKNFVKEMLEKFMESAENGLREMKTAQPEDSFEKIGNITHKLASPCRHIGALKLLKHIKHAEHLASNSGNAEEIKDAITNIANEYTRVKTYIKEHLENLSN
ncbi:MAG: response regulator [Bacteroidales bacterium]|nr:response regulator [Bacteroidales bacterium]